MGHTLYGPQLKQGFHKVLYLDYCFTMFYTWTILRYINDLSNDLASNPKLFADDTSLFSMVENMNKSANDINSDLVKIIFQQKMNFNLDSTNQAQEVILVSLTECQKHLAIVLDSRLDFKEYLEIIFKKFSKTEGLLRKLQNTLPRKPLITVYNFLKDHTWT